MIPTFIRSATLPGVRSKALKITVTWAWAMAQVDAYDNSARLIYDMERYGVDMCIIQPAFGMSNEIGLEQVKKYPDKFAANCQAGLKHTRDKVASGEMEWSIEAVLEELDSLLKTGNYVGIGKGMPMIAARPPEPVSLRR